MHSHERKTLDKELITDQLISALPVRGLNAETCDKYGYGTSTYHNKPCQVANYYDPAGNLVAQKLRFQNKKFEFIGDTKNIGLFGSQLFGRGKKIVITEGEIDALSMSQVQGNKWPVVSVPTGATGAPKAIAKSLEYLAEFEEVILMFDMDDPGRTAAQECAEILGPARCRIASLPLKDANEMLVEGRVEELINAMWNARPYKPEGVVLGVDLLDSILKDNDALSIPYPWAKMNEKTHGLRMGELVTLCAGTGTGKSAMVRELAYHLGNTHNQKVGMLMLEESTRRTGLGIMSVHAQQPLHLDRSGVSDVEMTQIFKETLGNGNYYLLDHFGSSDPESLLNRMRYLRAAYGCNWIFLDHLSIVVSGMAEGDNMDERKTIDLAMTRFRTLVEEMGFGLILVNHLKRIQGKGHENGATVELSHLRGSQSIAQLSDIVLGLERDQQTETVSPTLVRILKNRYSGETGLATYLEYERRTGRLFEVVGPTAFGDASPTPTGGDVEVF